jgi:hypothetical protein
MILNTDVIITGVIGIVASISTGWGSWFFARKKYNTEVASNEIENLKKSLEFYEQIISDNNTKLQLYIEMAENNNKEVYRLKSMVYKILSKSCLDDACLKRQFYSGKEVTDILQGTNKEDLKNEINTK